MHHEFCNGFFVYSMLLRNIFKKRTREESRVSHTNDVSMINLSEVGFDFILRGSIVWLVFLVLIQIAMPVSSYLLASRIKDSKDDETGNNREKSINLVRQFFIILFTVYTLTYIFNYFHVNIYAFESTEQLRFSQWIGVALYRVLYYSIPVFQIYMLKKPIVGKGQTVNLYDSVFFVFTCLIVYRFIYVFLGLNYLFGTNQETMKNIDLINTTLIVIVLYVTSGYKKREGLFK
jgi:hypothetical protein